MREENGEVVQGDMDTQIHTQTHTKKKNTIHGVHGEKVD